MSYKKTRFNKTIIVQDLCECARKGTIPEKTIKRKHKKGNSPYSDTFSCKGCGNPMGVFNWHWKDQQVPKP